MLEFSENIRSFQLCRNKRNDLSLAGSPAAGFILLHFKVATGQAALTPGGADLFALSLPLFLFALTVQNSAVSSIQVNDREEVQ